MRKLFSFKSIFVSASFIAMLIVPTAYSQDNPAQNMPEGAVKMAYQFLGDKPLSYRTEGKIVQDMDINGQSMLVNISTYAGCTVMPEGNKEGNLVLEVKIDSLAQVVDSPQGVMGGPVTDVKGKSFKAVLAPNGKTIDISGAKEITYSSPGGDEVNAYQIFSDFFPLLPVNDVNIGDKWITNDTSDIKNEYNSRYMPVESNCVFEGYEDIDGIRCAKITASIKGTMKITNQSQGMEVTSSGDLTGERALYFAVDKGYYVKEIVKYKMNGTVEIADQGMSFPVVMDITTTNELIR
jgi:hypothetical protein